MLLATIFGRLTREPEMKTSGSGVNYVTFAVAVNHGKDSQGQEKATFIELSAFGKTSETVIKYLHKGNRICLAAELELEKWTTQDGRTGNTLRGNVQRLDIVDWPEQQAGAQTTPPRQQPAQQSYPTQPPAPPMGMPQQQGYPTQYPQQANYPAPQQYPQQPSQPNLYQQPQAPTMPMQQPTQAPWG